jgi:hypothetical protein
VPERRITDEFTKAPDLLNMAGVSEIKLLPAAVKVTNALNNRKTA